MRNRAKQTAQWLVRLFSSPSNAEAKAIHPAPSDPLNGEVTTHLPTLRALISDTTTISGSLEVRGGIKIDGTIEGSVNSTEGALVLVGRVKGDIHAEVAFIEGTVDGNLFATEVYLGSDAKVHGRINYTKMQWNAGAVVEGTLHQNQEIAKVISEIRAKPIRNVRRAAPTKHAPALA